MSKTALVISGGGSKGAFAVGVLKYMAATPKIQFDTICGTSTGSLIAPLAALGEINLLEKLYTTHVTSDIVVTGNVIARFAGKDTYSLFDAQPLSLLIKKTFTDQMYKDILDSGKSLYFTTVCLQTGRITYFTNSDLPLTSSEYDVIRIQDASTFRRAMFASSCQPVFMPPYQVIENQPRQYVDGGLREYAPVDLAIDNGATEIYAILLTPENPAEDNQHFKSPFEILQQTMDWFTMDVAVNDLRMPKYINRSLQYIKAVKSKMKEAGLKPKEIEAFFDIPFDNPFLGKSDLKLHIIRPEKPMNGGPGGLTFDPPEMKKMVAHGEEVARKYFENL
ncbi:patatin-like phospholipase family protein [Chitinophaga barathri]|uniref:Patatin-like phospholipase family protein n=1 Tax=Chitinophaga barathri TaxID=1647451 RepID=A0A3N4M6I8_9BACT|nr:patatin-like phospholipase family protein [Chitinophaga barathri]RPD38922.1 patatin-like phospholipase family protein [Chitinophaga barathri]